MERKLGELVAGIDKAKPGPKRDRSNVGPISRKEFLASLDATQRDGARWMKLHEVDVS